MKALQIDTVSFSVIDAVFNLPGHQYGYYRILVASSAIKYLAFLPSKPTFPDIPNYRGEKLGFTTVPRGDWNFGRLDYDVATDELVLQSTERTVLQRVKDLWHPAQVDYLFLGQFGADQVVVKTEWYPDSVYAVDQETLIYSKIEGHNIGPKFLAHITKNGERVYGYMLESHLARHATIGDLQASKAVLAKLHGLKIVYGNLSSLSFLIVDGRALLYGFGGSFSTDYQSLFDAEMASVEDVLQRGSPSTQHISDELHAEIFAISQRDDGIYPDVIRQAAEQSEIVITEWQHKKLLQELRERLREARSHKTAF